MALSEADLLAATLGREGPRRTKVIRPVAFSIRDLWAGLMGLSLGVYGVQQAVNWAFGKPIEPPSEAVVAVAGLLVVASIASAASRFLPQWLMTIEGGEIQVDDGRSDPPVIDP